MVQLVISPALVHHHSQEMTPFLREVQGWISLWMQIQSSDMMILIQLSWQLVEFQSVNIKQITQLWDYDANRLLPLQKVKVFRTLDRTHRLPLHT